MMDETGKSIGPASRAFWDLKTVMDETGASIGPASRAFWDLKTVPFSTKAKWNKAYDYWQDQPGLYVTTPGEQADEQTDGQTDDQAGDQADEQRDEQTGEYTDHLPPKRIVPDSKFAPTGTSRTMCQQSEFVPNGTKP